jgi:hypothetical protein
VKFYRITLCYEGLKANVHTGAPPPWLEGSENDPKNGSLASHALPSSGKGKSRKLNPKRVGAAWAEKRRAEMEMEKRGEVVPETSDSSWLPNFGGVWQSGSRKESMKDFEKKHKLPEKNNPELSPEIKPYISKRMVNVFSHFLISLSCTFSLLFRILVCWQQYLKFCYSSVDGHKPLRLEHRFSSDRLKDWVKNTLFIFLTLGNIEFSAIW